MRQNKLCVFVGRKTACRRYRRVLYFLAAMPYYTTFRCETWHNRAAEAAHAVTFDFSSGFYNRFSITGCRIRRFLCRIHHRRVLSRRDGFPARLLLYFLCLTSRLYSALPQEMSIAESPQDRKKLPQTLYTVRLPRLAKKKLPQRSQKDQVQRISTYQSLCSLPV